MLCIPTNESIPWAQFGTTTDFCFVLIDSVTVAFDQIIGEIERVVITELDETISEKLDAVASYD